MFVLWEGSLEVQPMDVESLLESGLEKLKAKAYEEAIKDFDQAIQHAPSYPKLYSGRATARAYVGQSEGALEDWDQYISLVPDDAIAYCNRGLVQMNFGVWEEVIADYEMARQLDPHLIARLDYTTKHYFADAYYERGVAHFKRKNYLEAIADYDTALSIGVPSDKRAKISFLTGTIYSSLGDKKTAIEKYQESAQIFFKGGYQSDFEKVLNIIEEVRKNKHKEDDEVEIESLIQTLGNYEPKSISILKHLYTRGILDDRSQYNNCSVAISLLKILELPRADGLEAKDIFWSVLERLHNPFSNTQLINIPFSNQKMVADTCASASRVSHLIWQAGEYTRIVEELTTPKLSFTVIRKYDDPRLFQAKVQWLEGYFNFEVVDKQTLSIQVSVDANALIRAILEHKNRKFLDYNFGQRDEKNSRNVVDVLLQSAITNYALRGNYDSSFDEDRTDQTSGVPTESFGALSLDYDILGIETVVIRGPAATSENWISTEPIIRSPLQAYDSPLPGDN
jgi:tetratricopeptide (TPR) repeat protein